MVHVITGDAVGRGDPAVVVTAADGGDIGPRVLELHRWLAGPGAPIRAYDGLVINGCDQRTGTIPDLDELVCTVGWKPLAQWRVAAVGYYRCPVERDWPSTERVPEGA